MPPSATATDYDAGYAHQLMENLDVPASSTFKRAVGALLLCAVGAFVLIVVLSYNPFDSTGDTAGSGGVQNLMGRPGAGLSNILLQVFGWGSILAAVLTLFAGVRAIIRPRVSGTKLDTARRFLIWFGAVIFGTATLSAFPIPQSWPMAGGLGGWVGDSLYLNAKGALDHFNLPLSGLVIALLTFVAGGFCLGRFLRIVAKDLIDIMDAAGLVWAYIRIGIDKMAIFVTKLFKKNYVEPMGDTGTIDNLYRTLPDEPQAAPKPKRVRKPKAKVAAPAPAPVAAKTPAKKKRKAKPKQPEEPYRLFYLLENDKPTLDESPMPLSAPNRHTADD